MTETSTSSNAHRWNGLRDRVRNFGKPNGAATAAAPPERSAKVALRTAWTRVRDLPARLRRALVLRAWAPRADVRDEAGARRVYVDVPGAKRNDLDIRVVANRLVVSCRREAASVDERAIADFTRRFALPDRADVERVTAELRDGVLSIVVPIKAEPVREVAIAAS